MQATAPGSVDLVFDVEQNDELNSYRVFQKVINATDGDLAGFQVELGFGLGDNFLPSIGGDGLGFNLNERQNARFPFGLFGDASTNQNHSIDGFFDQDSRSGFLVNLEEDLFDAQDLFGSYPALFGSWMSRSQVPDAYFWDNDGDPTTDDILMAYLNEDGEWVQAREAVGDVAEPLPPTVVTEQSLIDAGFILGEIEDLSNVNVDYFVSIGDITDWLTFDNGVANFTLRLTTFEVPAPATLLLFAVGLPLLARRRSTLF